MNYKIQKTIEKNKKTFIVALVLWLFITIVFVLPIARAWNVTIMENGKMVINDFLDGMVAYISKPLDNIANIGAYFGTFVSLLWKVTLLFAIFYIVGLVKTAPKSEYEDIEHGSSDWCEHGEQYRTLSPNKGILLAEKNYLPVDKRGNVNILVVGRFWCW